MPTKINVFEKKIFLNGAWVKEKLLKKFDFSLWGKLPHNFYCTIFPFLGNFVSMQTIFISHKITLLCANAKKKITEKNPITEVRRRLYFSSGYKKHICIYDMVTWRKNMNSLPTTTTTTLLFIEVFQVSCREYLWFTFSKDGKIVQLSITNLFMIGWWKLNKTLYF